MKHEFHLAQEFGQNPEYARARFRVDLPQCSPRAAFGFVTAPSPLRRFFLETCLDQLDYMSGCLAVETLERRITGYAALRESTGDWPAGSGNMLRDACLRGEIARGDVPRLIGKSPRTAQTVIQRLLQAGALTTSGPKGPLSLGWPPVALPAWLPGLFV